MKIGEVSRLSKTPIDTIRYYISLGLLNPARKNGQYVFSVQDFDDISYIQTLKQMHFSLKEIETFIRVRHTSTGLEPGVIKEYTFMLEQKKHQLLDEERELQAAVASISQEIKALSQRKISLQTSTGVPLRALPLLTCPRCGAQLKIEQAFFAKKYLKEGLLVCDCGYTAKIDQGIIATGNRYTGSYDSPDTQRDLYKTLCKDLLKMYQNSCSYILQGLQALDLSGKVVLEGSINGYFFLYNHFSQLPKDCLYIVVDKYPETILMYKDLIEKLNLDLDILYIADAAGELPLKSGCVDVLIDFFGNNEWQLYHPAYFFQDILTYLSPDCRVLGSFIDFRANSQTQKNLSKKYPESSVMKHIFRKLQSALEEASFYLDHELGGVITETQNSYSYTCHVAGEELRYYLYRAHRRV